MQKMLSREAKIELFFEKNCYFPIEKQVPLYLRYE